MRRQTTPRARLELDVDQGNVRFRPIADIALGRTSEPALRVDGHTTNFEETYWSYRIVGVDVNDVPVTVTGFGRRPLHPDFVAITIAIVGPLFGTSWTQFTSLRLRARRNEFPSQVVDRTSQSTG